MSKRAVTLYVSERAIRRLAKLAKQLRLSKSQVVDGLCLLPLKFHEGLTVSLEGTGNGTGKRNKETGHGKRVQSTAVRKPCVGRTGRVRRVHRKRAGARAK